VLSLADKAIERDPTNGALMAYGAYALATLGEPERAKTRMSRALLIDPDNLNLRYNFACVLLIHLNETEAALDVLGPVLEKVSSSYLNHIKADPDFFSLRDNPRFKAMIGATEARLLVPPLTTTKAVPPRKRKASPADPPGSSSPVARP
jgi:adenylate cyclase